MRGRSCSRGSDAKGACCRGQGSRMRPRLGHRKGTGQGSVVGAEAAAALGIEGRLVDDRTRGD